MPAKILVIEDHPANIELMELLLTSYNYGFAPAVDGEQGVEAALRERPDLVVCDIHLPKLDGYGVLALLKQHPALRFTPVLAVSALAMVGDREKLLSAGFDGYISKPIDPQTFIAQIEAYLPESLRAPPPMLEQDSGLGDLCTPGGPRVLVVDDAADGRAELCATLESLDFRARACASPSDAMAELRADPVDLVLCDVRMPGDDGWTMLGMVKDDPALASIPVVLITVTPPNAASTDRGAAAGAAALLHRPIEPTQLAERLHACLHATPGKNQP